MCVQSSLTLVETEAERPLPGAGEGVNGSGQAPPSSAGSSLHAYLWGVRVLAISDSGEGTLLQGRHLTKSWLLLLQKKKGSAHK